MATFLLENKKIARLVRSACGKTIAEVKRLFGKESPTDDVVHREYKILHKHSWETWSANYQTLATVINIMVPHDDVYLVRP